MVVGIGGGVPCLGTGQDVRLGDAVIGNKVVMYRSGTRTDHGFEHTRTAEAAPESIMSALTKLMLDLMKGHGLQFLVEEAAANETSRQIDYARQEADLLFKTEAPHDNNCCECLRSNSVRRNIRRGANLSQSSAAARSCQDAQRIYRLSRPGAA